MRDSNDTRIQCGITYFLAHHISVQEMKEIFKHSIPPPSYFMLRWRKNPRVGAVGFDAEIGPKAFECNTSPIFKIV